MPATHPLTAAAPQHIQNQGLTEPLPGAVDAVEDILGRLRHIHFLELGQAVTAVATVPALVFPEIFQHVLPETVPSHAVIGHFFQALTVFFLDFQQSFLVQFLVFLVVVDEEFVGAHILSAVQKDTLRGKPIPSGASCLLVVAFQILGHVVVNDIAHIRLVDAHAEGIGSYHNPFPVVNKILLVAVAFLVLQARMVAGGRKTGVIQPVTDLLHQFPGNAVDNAAVLVMLDDIGQNLPEFILGGADFKVEILPVKACGNLEWFT